MAAEAGRGRRRCQIDMEGGVLRIGGIFRLRVTARAAREGEIELRVPQRSNCLPPRVALLARLEMTTTGDWEARRLRGGLRVRRHPLQRTVRMAEEAIRGLAAGSGAGAAPELRPICWLRADQPAVPGILVGRAVADSAVD